MKNNPSSVRRGCFVYEVLGLVNHSAVAPSRRAAAQAIQTSEIVAGVLGLSAMNSHTVSGTTANPIRPKKDWREPNVAR